MKTLIFFFLMIPLMLVSQTPQETIKEMRNGSLFVRLMTRDKSIQAMKEMGKTDAAQELRDKQKEENLEVIKAFEENFDFCEVYYFYTTNSIVLMEGELKGYLLDANLNPIPYDHIAEISSYFIAEFGQIEPAESTYFTHYSLEQDQAGNTEIRANYGGDTEIGASALILRSADFKQLGRPFPYYVRTREGLPWSRSTSKAVTKLNEKLFDYFEKSK